MGCKPVGDWMASKLVIRGLRIWRRTTSKRIEHRPAQGPVFSGGVLFWRGTAAFEMAQQLRAQGQGVALLALLNAPAPVPCHYKPLCYHLRSCEA